MKIIDKEKRAQILKSYSTWVVGAAAVFVAAWGQIPDDLKAALPPWLVTLFAVGYFLLFIGAKLIQQFPKDGGQK